MKRSGKGKENLQRIRQTAATTNQSEIELGLLHMKSMKLKITLWPDFTVRGRWILDLKMKSLHSIQMFNATQITISIEHGLRMRCVTLSKWQLMAWRWSQWIRKRSQQRVAKSHEKTLVHNTHWTLAKYLIARGIWARCYPLVVDVNVTSQTGDRSICDVIPIANGIL